jgi:hypothetical protein
MSEGFLGSFIDASDNFWWLRTALTGMIAEFTRLSGASCKIVYAIERN